jgi:hypothetical protein
MLSQSMRAALEAKTIGERSRIQDGPRRLPIGDRRCPECGWPVSQLEYDEQANPTGPLYEHRAHGEHSWPQLHRCELGPDECPFCKGCADC